VAKKCPLRKWTETYTVTDENGQTKTITETHFMECIREDCEWCVHPSGPCGILSISDVLWEKH